MKKQFFLVLAALFGVIGLNTVRADYQYPTGAVRGVFTVARGTQVVFAQGNLQYTESTNEWRFATNQYDIIGEANKSIGKNTYGGAIDLFGWGTGANPLKYDCTSCQTTFEMAGPDPDPKGTWDAGRRNSPKDDGYNDFIDWGKNAITNGGNKAGKWRTLTAEEWDYVIRLRDKADMRFSLGKVADVKGLILLPDEWTLPDNLTFVDAQSVGMDISAEGVFSNINESNFELNDYSVAQWQSMQDNGAVFLPAAGSRAETTCSDLGEEGFYWSSTPSEDATAFSLGFTKGIVAPRVTEPRASGQAVRLVAPISDNHTFTVNDEGKQVWFAKGNLQYQPNTETYRFASAQTEYIGEANKNVGYQYTGWVDLFLYKDDAAFIGDGTFGFGGELKPGEGFDVPNRKNAPMGDEMTHLNWDEIVISNGGDKKGIWKPLSVDEWRFLFLTRDDAADKFGFATVDGVKGLMILPDDWIQPSECDDFQPASSTMTRSGDIYIEQNLPAGIYELNKYYSSDQSWKQMEEAGAVFLPAAGIRAKLDCAKLGESGFYYSSSSDVDNKDDNVFLISFNENEETHKLEFNPAESNKWDRGCSYRLVKDYEEEDDVQPFIVTIKVKPEEGGEVHDEKDEPIVSAEITFGDILSLTAVEKNPGYKFEKWEITEEGAPASITSTDNPYPLTASADVTVTAYFTEIKYHSLMIAVEPERSGYVEDIYHIQVADTMLQEGESLILTAIPVDENYIFGRWEYADGDDVVEDGAQITFKMGTTDATIKVYFDKATPTYYTWSIEVNDPDGGMVKQITEAGEEDVTGSQITDLEAGDEVQLKAYENYGYEFEKWVVTDVDGTREYGKEENPKTFTVENSDATVTAHFKNILHTLDVVVEPAEGGSVYINYGTAEQELYSGESLEEWEQVTMTVEDIQYGFAFDRWEVTGTGSSVSDEESLTTTFTMGTSDATVTAHFKNILHTLDVVVDPVAGGSVYINYGTAEQELYSGESLVKGEQVTMTVVEEQYGLGFDRWEYPEGANVVVNGNEITFTMDEEDVTITAHFKNILHTLNVVVEPAEGGSVYINYGTAEQELYSGESLEEWEQVTMTAVANDDYTFTGWSIGDEIVSTKFEYIFKMQTTDVTLKAKFSEIVDEPETHILTIVINPAEGGSVGQDGVPFTEYTFEMQEGETKQLIATNATDYQFAGWEITEGDGTLSDLEDIVTTFKMGTTNTTVTAKFDELYRVTIGVSPEAGDNKVILGGVYTISDYMHLSMVKNAVLDLEAQTDANYVFVGWEKTIGDVTSIIGTDYTLQYTVTEKGATIVAKYERLYTLNVTVYPEAGGVVKVNADDLAQASYKMKKGDTQTLIAEKAGGYTFTGWSIGDEIVSTNVEYTFKMDEEDVTLKAVFTAEHVHKWGETDYSWSADNLQCTATRICLEDATHIETETVNATMTTEVTKEATCEEAGETTTTYTFTFVNQAFNTVEPIVITTPILALGHNPLETVYTWDADYATCTARQVCGNDASHVITETVSATTEAVGGSLMVHTADFTQNDFKDQPFVDQKATCVTMSKYGFLSLYADKAYAVTQGLNALIYTGINGRNLIYQHITVIPAYTGVFFYGEANKTYELVETSTTMTYPDNLLHGTLTTQTIPDNGNVKYILSRLENTDKGGMYWPKGTNRGVGEFMNVGGKAYLEIPSSAGVAPRYFTMRGEACEEVTPVEEAQVDGDGKYYDILGREVREPQAQQIYIRNGKKVLYTK